MAAVREAAPTTRPDAAPRVLDADAIAHAGTVDEFLRPRITTWTSISIHTRCESCSNNANGPSLGRAARFAVGRAACLELHDILRRGPFVLHDVELDPLTSAAT